MILSYLKKKLDAPVLGLFDYNPYGVSILYDYKYGSIHQGLETFKYGLIKKY